jgi:hypothetical protein
MRRILGLVLVALLLIPASVNAFDGFRKGFVLGGGAGFVPHASWSFDDPFDRSVTYDESKASVGFQFVIGYAWDELNMIVYEGNVTAYNSSIVNIITDDYTIPINHTVGQGFNGASWYHYFGPKGKTFFTTVGIGFYIFDVQDFDANSPGGAFLVGGGYEFTPHVQVGAYISAGKTTDPILDFSHSHISFLVSAVAF